MATNETAAPPLNRLLGLLSARDYQRLRPHLHRIPQRYRQSLYQARRPIRFVYFIESGVGSLVNTMANGDAAEVGTIGNEGVVGLPLLLGDDRAPTSVYVQVPGAGLSMTAALFERELARSASMRMVMLHYAHAFFNQVAQSAACNQFHSIERRCCRWLLMTHERMQSDEISAHAGIPCHDAGVQRTGVSTVAAAVQRAGLIRYKRGKVTIIDRAGLIRRSCECYAVPRTSSIVCSAFASPARPSPKDIRATGVASDLLKKSACWRSCVMISWAPTTSPTVCPLKRPQALADPARGTPDRTARKLGAQTPI